MRGDAGDIAARPVEARDETEFDRVAGGAEDDRNCRGRGLAACAAVPTAR